MRNVPRHPRLVEVNLYGFSLIVRNVASPETAVLKLKEALPPEFELQEDAIPYQVLVNDHPTDEGYVDHGAGS